MIWAVALGGAIGASLRYFAGMAVLRAFGANFPVSTLSVNVIGSFVMGVMITALTARDVDLRIMAFVTTGVLGGFTTFSAFSLDAIRLLEAGRIGAASLYIGASVGLSLLGVFAGIMLARGVYP